ncbi:MAG: PAS domain S-box protein, partial [Candidatus Hydrogenedentes bacterium]|nr:PAS domain S-box protein [Candidatus Hydrogenedentota bacterium]
MLNDAYKTKPQLLEEIRALRDRVAVLEDAAEKTGPLVPEDPRSSGDDAGRHTVHLQIALRASRAGCFEYDFLKGVGFWSPELEAIYGMASGSFSGDFKDWEACVLPEDLAQTLLELRRAVEHEESVSSAFRIRRKDNGDIRWIETRGTIIRDANGRATRVVGINTDVTDRMESAAALRTSVDRLRLAQRAALAGIWDWDMPSGTLIWTDEFYALFRLDASAAPSFDTWLAVVHPDDRDAAMARVSEAVERHVSLENEYRIILPDGRVRWIGATGDTFYDNAGQPQRMCGVCIDITSRKEYESELKRARSLYAALSHVNQVIVRTRSRGELFRELCRVLVEFGEFSAAWIGKHDPDSQTFTCVARDGMDGTASALPFCLDDKRCGACPIRTSVLEGRPHICNDLRNSAFEIPCRDTIAQSGLTSAATFPIREKGELRGMLTVYSREAGFFGPSEVSLLEETVADITFGLETIQIEESRWQAEAELHASEQRYRTLVEQALDGIALTNADGRFVSVNASLCEMTGYSADEMLEMTVSSLVARREHERFRDHLAAAGARVLPLSEWGIVRKDGSHISVEISLRTLSTHERLFVIRNVTERMHAEWRQRATIDLLGICNEASSVEDLLHCLMGYFQDVSGCSAVGARLKQGWDFPYYETRGFDKEFVRLESHLCVRDADGEILRDGAGNPVLECMCGNVLCGRFDPEKSFFTSRGSFWTSCTTDLLTSTTEADRQARTRNRCNGEGYESVALVPIRSGGATLGLFQFNDRRKGRFSPELIDLLEDLVDYVAIALAKLRNEEALRESESRFRTLFEQSNDAIFLHGVEKDGQPTRFIEVNKGACSHLGYTREELLRMSPYDINAPEARDRWPDIIAEMKHAGQAVFELIHVCRDGRQIPVEISARIFQYQGRPHALTIARDISERKKAEQAIRTTLESITDGFLSFDAEWRCDYINPAAERMLGAEAKELRSRSFWDVFSPVIGTRLEQEYRRAAAGEVRTFENLYEPWQRWFLNRCYPREGGGMTLYIQEISAQKEAEAALRASEKHYRTILLTAMDGFWRLGAEGQILEVNEAYCQMSGYTADELLGMCIGDLEAVESPSETKAHVRKVLAEGYDRFETRHRRKDGQTFDVEASVQLVGGEDGQMVVFMRDISERKRAEEVIRESERRLATLIANLPGFVYRCKNDPNWTMEYVSGGSLSVTGYAPEDFLDNRRLAYNDIVRPDAQEPLWNSIQEAIGERRPFELEYPIIMASGDTRWVWERGQGIFDEKDRLLFLEGFITDVTARRHAEEELREVYLKHKEAVSAGNVGLWDWNLVTNKVTYSAEWKSQIGYGEHEITDDFEEWRTRVHPDDLQQALERVGAAISESRQNHQVEFRFRHKDGSYRWILVQASVLMDETGRPVRMLGSHVDITERKRAEEALSLDAAIFKNITEGIVLVGAEDNRIKYANASFEEMFGYGPGELLGEDIAILNADKGVLAEAVRDQVMKSTMQYGEWHGEIRNSRKDGSLLWTYGSASTFTHPEFDPVVLGVQADITENKRVEEALREREETLNTVFENSRVALEIFDKSGVLRRCNKRTAEIFGVDIAAQLGKFNLTKDPNYQDPEVWRRLRRGEEVEGEVLFDYGKSPYTTSHNGVAHLYVITTPVPDAVSSDIGYIVQVIDISDLKRAEAQLRDTSEQLDLMLRSTGVGIWHWDVLEQRLFCDAQTLQLLGIAPGSFQSTYEEFYGALDPELRETVDSLVNRSIQDGAPYEAEYRVLWPDKSVHHLSARGRAVQDTAGQCVRLDGVIWDATEQKLLEQQLLHSQKMEAIGQLAGGVAHDFNNLLQVILVNVDIAQDGIKPDSAEGEMLGEIRTAAERAADLTRQLLAFSRRQIIRPVRVDVNDLVQGVLKMLRRLIGEHIELCFLPGSHVADVLADKGQVEQVIMNLCVNARDAMPRGGRLTIETGNEVFSPENCRLHRWAREGAYALLRITDTGEGMDAATQERIFEPFFTTKEVGKGTGLGLATVYGIIRQHFGLINVYSEPGVGTVFTIYLPVVERDAARDDAEAAAPVVGGTETILVAEDDHAILRTLAMLLRGSGYTVLTAADGKEAVQTYKENADSIDLVMLDVVMPGMSGREVMTRIQAMGSNVPFLFSSGYSEDAIHT